MTDLPVFTAADGLATLILHEIPAKREAYILVRTVFGALDGLLLGWIYRGLSKKAKPYVACAITGFLSAFLNTLFFMTALLVLFGGTEYVQGLVAGRNLLVFVCAFVGVNAVAEMAAATVLTGAVGAALGKAGLLDAHK